MSPTKSLSANQHYPPHMAYGPGDCCLCRAEQRIADLERALRHAEQTRDEAQAAASAEVARRRAAEAECERLRTALRFYAGSDNWDPESRRPVDCGWPENDGACHYDEGAIARRALRRNDE